MNSSTKQNAAGKYILPLPFKQKPELPYNRPQVERRFAEIVKKFKMDAGYHK